MMKVAVQFEDAEAFTQHDFEFHEDDSSNKPSVS